MAICGHARQHPGALPCQPHARLVPALPPHPQPARLRHGALLYKLDGCLKSKSSPGTCTPASLTACLSAAR